MRSAFHVLSSVAPRQRLWESYNLSEGWLFIEGKGDNKAEGQSEGAATLRAIRMSCSLESLQYGTSLFFHSQNYESGSTSCCSLTIAQRC